MEGAVLQGAWWQRGVVYQVYPRSFQDSNDDGIGDLRGITQRLDYFTWLGVDALWLSPIYPSPMLDFGYDISNFTDIDPIFGTLKDFDELVEEAHRRDLRVILDYVPNHTSHLHPWFVEARKSRQNPRRDWYVWRDPGPDGGPPNNWLSEFGGSAWEYDTDTGQYYYHAFLKEQPDLNWRNSDLRRAMHDVLRFWLKRGVDGFRIDVVHHLIEDEQFRDNPPNPDFIDTQMRPSHALLRIHTVDQPEMQGIITGLRRVVDEYPEKVLIGEIHLPIDRLVTYYGVELSGIHLPFNFNLIGAAWSAEVLRELIATYEAALPSGAWPNWVVGNHDTSRIASRVGEAGARMAMMLLLTLRGTPTIYYGEELGMADVPISPEQVRDPFEKNVPGLGVGRDPARTPMRWTPEEKGGFTQATPWLPMGEGIAACNVESQMREPRSILNLCRRLLALRRARPALAVGSYLGLPCESECLAFIRRYEAERLLVLLNLSIEPQIYEMPADLQPDNVLFSSVDDSPPQSIGKKLQLEGGQGMIVGLAR